MITNPYKSHVLITGGTGLVGKRLSDELASRGYIVSHLSRNRATSGQFETFVWNPSEDFIEEKALENVDYIIHACSSAGAAGKTLEQ
ncbi:MAG: NAD-dependent epimerase/dehydratase family protein [Cyclobacteriaceae bacterium]|nr:NAD-dependent epimerase/dehydratase family protein [Cyclobacteriaceae bacterium]